MKNYDFRSGAVNYRFGMAGDHIDLSGPEAVVLTEPAVLKALRVTEPIFLPKQSQSHAGGGVTRRAPTASQASVFDHWELVLAETNAVAVQRRSCRGPRQPAGSEAIEIITDGGSPDLQAGGYLTSR